MIVGRTAEGFVLYCVVALKRPQEVGGQRLRAVELQPGGRVHWSDGAVSLYVVARKLRRVLRSRCEGRAVRNRVDVEAFRQMARERADITDAQDGVEPEVMLYLEAEALHVR